MGSISNYLENKLLDHILKNSAYTPPANIYVALSKADPGDDASGLDEPSGGGYARAACNSWGAAFQRVIQNSVSVVFPTATGDWGTITHIALYDAITGGNMLAHAQLSVSKTVNTGNVLSIPSEAIAVTINAGGMSTYLANAILNHVFKVTTFSQVSNIYVALSTSTIVDSTSGGSISEPPSNYARVAHNSWDAAVNGASENTGAIDWDTSTTEWGSITQWALMDALTGGNMLLYGELTQAYALVIGDDVTIADGDLEITLS